MYEEPMALRSCLPRNTLLLGSVDKVPKQLLGVTMKSAGYSRPHAVTSACQQLSTQLELPEALITMRTSVSLLEYMGLQAITRKHIEWKFVDTGSLEPAGSLGVRVVFAT